MAISYSESYSIRPLLRDSSHILMQTIPPSIDMEGLRRKMLEQLPEVEDIHEFHVWSLVGNKVLASVHAILRREVSRSDHMLNARRIKVVTFIKHYSNVLLQ